MSLLVPPPAVLRPELRTPLADALQAAFTLLARDVDAGQEVGFAVEGRPVPGGGPSLYAYRPLFGPYIDERRAAILELRDVGRAIGALVADPGAMAYARREAGDSVGDAEAVREAILWPLLVGVAERQDAFDFSESAFDALYGPVERHVVHDARRLEAFAPLTGLLVGHPPVELASGIVLVRAGREEVSRRWPETLGLLPDRFASEPDRRLGLELVVADGRDAVAPAAAAVSALRLAGAGAVAAGPLLFSRLDLEPRAVQALPAGVATALEGPSVRLDTLGLEQAARLCARLLETDPASPVAVALERWSVVPGVEALEPLLGRDRRLAALRAAALVGTTAEERVSIAENVEPALRPVLAAAVLDDRSGAGLAETLDEVLLGARPRPRLLPDA
jgi:hypothetical protein